MRAQGVFQKTLQRLKDFAYAGFGFNGGISLSVPYF
jgi:hypothetical protein